MLDCVEPQWRDSEIEGSRSDKVYSEQCLTVTFSKTRYTEIMKITNSAGQHNCKTEDGNGRE